MGGADMIGNLVQKVRLGLGADQSVAAGNDIATDHRFHVCHPDRLRCRDYSTTRRITGLRHVKGGNFRSWVSLENDCYDGRRGAEVPYAGTWIQ